MSSLVAVLVGAIMLPRDCRSFVVMQVDSMLHAVTWEDDPKNWYRAFHENPPPGVKVVHSKYWRSNHFTYEYAYHFEVQATPEWKDTFLKSRGVERVASSRIPIVPATTRTNAIPWFRPGPIENYEIWDIPGHPGLTHYSIWIDKATGHIFFCDISV